MLVEKFTLSHGCLLTPVSFVINQVLIQLGTSWFNRMNVIEMSYNLNMSAKLLNKCYTESIKLLIKENYNMKRDNKQV